MSINVEVVAGVEGPSLYINDHRVLGNKPWGGGRTTHSWTVRDSSVKYFTNDIIESTGLPEFKLIPLVKEEYQIKATRQLIKKQKQLFVKTWCQNTLEEPGMFADFNLDPEELAEWQKLEAFKKDADKKLRSVRSRIKKVLTGLEK